MWARVVVAMALVACSDAPPPDPTKCPTLGGEHCFQLPTQPMSVAAMTKPKLGCSGLQPMATQQPYTLVGRVYDYQLGVYYTFPGAHIELYDSAAVDHMIGATDTDAM